MLTKGIIMSISNSDNTCEVRIPLFETAGMDTKYITTAILNTPPGLYGGYKEEDIVIVGFEENRFNKAVVLGKLFLGNEREREFEETGALQIEDLFVSNKASIPINTKLTQLGNNNQDVMVFNDEETFTSILEVIKAVRQLRTRVEELEKIIEQQTKDIEELKTKVK